MRSAVRVVCLVAFVLIGGSPLRAAEDAVDPLDGPVMEAPTLHSFGVHWVVGGDQNGNAVIRLDWREAGAGNWVAGMPIWRVEKGRQLNEQGRSSINLPSGASLFAGSVLLLRPGAEYEVRLVLADPDGGNREAVLKARTRTEPSAPPDAVVKHVIPGDGGGSGTAEAPFRGLAGAQANAKPGDLFLLHAGVYPGEFAVKTNGEPGRPIIWRGAGDGETILDAQGANASRPNRAVAMDGCHDVWFENLTVRNAKWAVVGSESARIVVRRCHIHQCDYGITVTRNDKDSVRDWFIADNLFEGPSVWPRSKGIENVRGIQITGEGHVICYNRIRGWGDGMDTYPSPRCADIDFHNNEVSECTDDGTELDYSERNVRSFFNRFTNCFQGISVQPVFGGPVLAFRNSLYNIAREPFKMHNTPSGAIFFHNTCVKRGMPIFVSTPEQVRHGLMRNNLFIGTAADYAFEMYDNPALRHSRGAEGIPHPSRRKVTEQQRQLVKLGVSWTHHR